MVFWCLILYSILFGLLHFRLFYVCFVNLSSLYFAIRPRYSTGLILSRGDFASACCGYLRDTNTYRDTQYTGRANKQLAKQTGT